MEDLTINKLGFSTRTTNALSKAGVYTLEHMLKLSEDDLNGIKNMGKKSVNEVLAFQLSYSEKGMLGVNILHSDSNDEFTVLPINLSEQLVINKAHPDTLNREIDTIRYLFNGNFKQDVEVSEIGFKTGTTNALLNAGFTTINQVAFLKCDELSSTKNIGKKSFNEIINFLGENATIFYAYGDVSGGLKEICDYIGSNILDKNNPCYEHLLTTTKLLLTKHEENIKNLSEKNDMLALVENEQFVDLVWKSEKFKEAYKKYVFSAIASNESGDNIDYKHLFYRIGIWESTIRDLISEKKIEVVKGTYKTWRPHVSDWLDSMKANTKLVCTLRLKTRLAKNHQGNTNEYKLEKIGNLIGVTRERVRQIVARELKKRPLLREDDYREIFKTYEFVGESFKTIFQETDQCYDYLSTVYEMGKEPLEKMMHAPGITPEMCEKIKHFVNKNKVRIGEEYVECKRDQLIKHLMKEYFSEEPKRIDDIYKKYMELLKEKGIEDNKKLIFGEYRNMYACIVRASYSLLSYGQKLRYYPKNEIDINDLVEQLRLDRFHNVEISSFKLFNENEDLMEEYNIKNGYELHYLLNDTQNEWNCDNKYDISFPTMPNINFGIVDRERQVTEFLYQVAPISSEDIASLYKEEYGVNERTFAGDYLPFISKYNHKGQLTVDQPLLDEVEQAYMCDHLKENFYFFDDIKGAYKRKFGDAHINRINSRTIKGLGYKVYTDCALSDNYANLAEYFRAFLLKNDNIDLGSIDRRFLYVPAFNSVLRSLRSDYELIEYEPRKFIKMSRIQSVYPDFSKKSIDEYVELAVSYAMNEKFFTLRWLKRKGFEHELHDIGLDEWFNASLIRQSRKLNIIKGGGTIIFHRGGPTNTMIDFIKYVLSSVKKMDIYDFLDMLDKEYGFVVDKDTLTYLLKESDMYYDSIMEKVYLDKSYYLDEIGEGRI